MQKPLYSIGIIFKNEIRCLERCLKSLQPLRDAVPCEVVMADTGSDDGSRGVAEKYADVLIDFPWCDDFAAARNAVMDRCSGKWYFSIDADEWLAEDVSELVAFAKEKNLPRDFGGIKIRNYKSVGLERDQNYVDFLAIRLARLSTGIRYQGCIHESWESSDGEPLKTMSLSNAMLYHDGYCYANKADEQAKRDRNMPLLRKKLEKNPEDLQTLLECIDSSKHTDAGSADYARRAVELVENKRSSWDTLGGVTFRNAVSVAQLHHLPEIKEWSAKGLEMFPGSMFVQIDMAYYTFVHYFDEKNWDEALRWGKMYQKGLADYRAGCFETSQSTLGVVEFASPFWERKISVLLPQVYLNIGEPERALEGIQEVKGGELEDEQQIELCVNMLVRLYRTTYLDVDPVLNAFWEQINHASPNEAAAEKRRSEFLRTAARTFTKQYRKKEAERDDFLRHGYGVFAVLKGRYALGTAAVVLETVECEALEELLAMVDNWDEFPISALEHALREGARFPLSGKPLKIEEMDDLAARMAHQDGQLLDLVILAANGEFSANWQSLLWARGLALAAVRTYDWTDEKLGMELCRAFIEIESAFLPRYYAEDLLCDENIHAIPPLHRFGWTCGKAFRALDAGDSTGYVRLLRQGLENCPEMKSMVEFLLQQLEKFQKVQAPPELLQLAEQVRTLLAAYPANDPAVLALKQSEAYQMVAHLIEGPELGVYGGLPQ